MFTPFKAFIKAMQAFKDFLAHADEGSAAAAKRLKRLPPMNPHAPVLSKEDYFTVPPVKRMRRFSDEELQVQPCSMETLEQMHPICSAGLSQTTGCVEKAHCQIAIVCTSAVPKHCWCRRWSAS